MAHLDRPAIDRSDGRRRLFGVSPPSGQVPQATPAVQPQPAAPGAGAGSREPVDEVEAASPGRDVGEDVGRILAALTTPAIWVDADGVVAWAHASLAALRLVRRGMLNSPDLTAVVQQCLLTDRPTVRAVTVKRPGRRQSEVRLRVRAAPMADGAALVLIEDITEAERLDHARRDFVANVSHELKTPIGALALLAEAAHQAEDDLVAVQRFTARMQVETRRLTTLINDLMDLSRLEGVEPQEPMAPVSVDDVVAQACDDVRSLAQDKGIRFLRGGISGLKVEGAAEQLATAVRNLIVNAVNYSPALTKVAVTTGESDGFVTISVTDQGIGIPHADLDRIFERFYRVDPARSRITGGTGLGLSIVKHVCANHGGDCEVWSKVGEGSTFTIHLPALGSAAARRSTSTRTSHSTPEEEQ